VRAFERRGLVTLALALLELQIAIRSGFVSSYNRYILNLGDDSPLIPLLKSRRYVFDLGDPCLFRDPFKIQKYDEYVQIQIRRSDALATTSKTLQSYIERLGGFAAMVENGTDYVSTDITNSMRPDMWPAEYSKVFAYVGGLNSRVDFDFLVMLAKSHPNVALFCTSCPTHDVIERIGELEKFQNVIMSGYISDDEVTYVLANCTAGVVPFTMDFIGDCINPQKLYDYSAFGKPIIATKTSEMLRFKEYVIFPDTSSVEKCQRDVADGLKVSMKQHNVNRRVMFASRSRWRDRSELIRKLILGQK
jgi:glycosyltransferase involved in cell wall biosynthesis